MSYHPQEYLIPDKQIGNLSYADVLRHSAGILAAERQTAVELLVLRLEIDLARFTGATAARPFPEVHIEQISEGIKLTCPCKSEKKTLCEHQAQVLYQVLDREYFRIFFDAGLRHEKISALAMEYGFSPEAAPEDYFALQYTDKAYQIVPLEDGLIPWNLSTASQLKENILPREDPPLMSPASVDENSSPILILSRNKYYEQFQIEYCDAKFAKNGTPKNPLKTSNVQEALWKASDLESIRFYSAIHILSKYEAGELTASTAEAWRAIIRNPLNLHAYLHDPLVAEQITAQSIRRVKLHDSRIRLCIQVDLRDVFHEVVCEMVLNDKQYPVKSLSIRNGYFVQIEDDLHFISDVDLLRVIQYFRKQRPIVLIHKSKFEAFKAEILDALEDRIQVKYSYIQAATEQQILEQGYEDEAQKLLYLSDRDAFVFVTPVMRYGQVEIPVFSQKQVYDQDANGNKFRVERDTEAEVAFLSILMRQHEDLALPPAIGNSFQMHKYRFLEEEWFLRSFEDWRQEGIEILGFNQLKKNELNPYQAQINIHVNSGIDWFETSIKVKYGKQVATLKQVLKAVKNRSKYIRLDDGTKGILPVEWLDKMESYFQSGELDGMVIRTARQNFADISRLYEEQMMSQELVKELKLYKKRFYDFNRIEEVPVPADLNATLREYQRQGLNWLNFLDEFNFGACLADDMGLGKTVQVIAFLLLQKQKKGHQTSLIVMPASLLFNWEEELIKFAPTLTYCIHHGSNRKKQGAHFSKYDIILSSYGTMISDVKMLKSFAFNYIILDESQAIKNPESQRYLAACMLKSRNRLVLTGTPIENNTFDLYGQFSFVSPGLLGNKQYFRDVYAKPIDQFEDHKRKKELQHKIYPFLLRRTKKQVAPELPEKTEMVIYCEMPDAQRQIYVTVEKDLREYIARQNEEVLKANSMYVLSGLTKLRQICNAPVLLKDEAFVDTQSAKLDVLIRQIEEKSEEHKILVFSQFVGMLDLIRTALNERGILHEYLTGQTKNRSKSVHAFQEDEKVRVFLISLKAGGTGLNLTAADYVYIVDPWWNPAVENQAIDRSHRIGQNKPVIAVRLICPNTVEEKIMKLQQSKKDLANDLVRTDTGILKSLNREEMLAILGEK